MHVEWDPEVEGEQKQTWQFDPGDVTRKQATKIEEHFDGSYDQWTAGLMMGKVHARAVLLWHMLSQVHAKIKFEDVPDFRVRQLTVQMGSAEIHDLWKRAKRIKMTPDQREAFEAQIVEDMKDALGREGKEPDAWIEDDLLKTRVTLELPKAA